MRDLYAAAVQIECPDLSSSAALQAYLVKVMEWKLTRGTFRPGLLQKVELNNDEEVRRCFATPDWKGLRHVMQMSRGGVGIAH